MAKACTAGASARCNSTRHLRLLLLATPLLPRLLPLVPLLPQPQAFHTLYHTDHPVLLGAPTGSGKTISAELCMLRCFSQYPGQKVGVGSTSAS